MINIVIFASGSGTNFQAVINAVERGQIQGNLKGLITNKSEIKAIERAHKHDIEHVLMAPSKFDDAADYCSLLLQQLKSWDTDLIVLAGYMSKIPTEIIQNYRNRIINIHPSLLPKYGGKGFYGMNVHQAVIGNGERESGCTVHFVTEKYDDGPILGRRKVPVKKDDTPQQLADRILKQEHHLLPGVIAKLAKQLTPKSTY